jgi:hypothetical protein
MRTCWMLMRLAGSTTRIFVRRSLASAEILGWSGNLYFPWAIFCRIFCAHTVPHVSNPSTMYSTWEEGRQGRSKRRRRGRRAKKKNTNILHLSVFYTHNSHTGQLAFISGQQVRSLFPDCRQAKSIFCVGTLTSVFTHSWQAKSMHDETNMYFKRLQEGLL